MEEPNQPAKRNPEHRGFRSEFRRESRRCPGKNLEIQNSAMPGNSSGSASPRKRRQKRLCPQSCNDEARTYMQTIPRHTVPFHAIPDQTIPCQTMPYHPMPSHPMPCHAIPYNAMPYHTMPYHIIQYHTIPHHIIPYIRCHCTT